MDITKVQLPLGSYTRLLEMANKRIPQTVLDVLMDSQKIEITASMILKDLLASAESDAPDASVAPVALDAFDDEDCGSCGGACLVPDTQLALNFDTPAESAGPAASAVPTVPTGNTALEEGCDEDDGETVNPVDAIPSYEKPVRRVFLPRRNNGESRLDWMRRTVPAFIDENPGAGVAEVRDFLFPGRKENMTLAVQWCLGQMVNDELLIVKNGVNGAMRYYLP
jgi:hypothetical protein